MSGRRSRSAVVFGIVIAAFAVAGIVGAFWSAGSGPGGNGHAVAGSLPKGATPSGSLVARDATITWAQSNVAGSLLGQLAGGGYTVARYAENDLTTAIAAGGSCAGTHSGPADPMSCTESSLATGRWSYTVTPVLYSWIGIESAGSTSLVIAPDAPLSIALTNGAGTGTVTLGDASTGGSNVAWRIAGSTQPTNNVVVSNSGTGSATLGRW